MTDPRSHQIKTLVDELTYDLRPGSPQADEVRQTLRRHLDEVREDIPRNEVWRLEKLIDDRTRGKG